MVVQTKTHIFKQWKLGSGDIIGCIIIISLFYVILCTCNFYAYVL